MAEPVIRAAGLTRTYPMPRVDAATDGEKELVIFRDLCFSAYAGEMVAIVGESGSGKSTLLHLLAGLDRPTSGEIRVGTQQMTTGPSVPASRLWNREIGYVWQFHYLLPEFTAAENIAMPLLARGLPHAEALRRADTWLAEVGLHGRGKHRSGELSGGEQQRVAIGRALVTEPRVLLADEPTGDLDASTAERIFALLQQLTTSRQLATVLVTHNLQVAHGCNRVIRLHAGKLEELHPL